MNPLLALLTALARLTTASSCPITLLCKISSNFSRRSLSDSVNFVTGTPVQAARTSAMCSEVILILSFDKLSCQEILNSSILLITLLTSSRFLAAISNSWLITALSFSLFNRVSSSSYSFNLSGDL